MHRALYCTCSLKSLPFSFPSLLQILVSFTMYLITVAVFPNLSIVDCNDILFSCVCNVLLIMPPHLHFHCPYSLCQFLVCDPLLFVPKICLLYWLLPTPHTSFVLLEFLTAVRLHRQDCTEISSTMVAQLRCWRISNLL